MIKPKYKLCVIDDVTNVVQGIAYHIPWADYHIEVIGIAMDGQAGLSLILDNEADIVLTDIRMPHMDGLEMTERIKQQLPSCKVILLSGYTDFDYAQKAIRLGAFDFVTKPFRPKTIVEAILKARDALDAEYEERQRISGLEKTVKESMPILRQEYFHFLLRHSASKADVEERWRLLQIGMEAAGIVVMIVEIDGLAERSEQISAQNAELLHFALQNIVAETLSIHAVPGVLCRDSTSRLVGLVNAGESTNLQAVAEEVRENVLTYAKQKVSIGISLRAPLLQDLPAAYQQAIAALSYNFYTGGNSVFAYSSIPQIGKQVTMPLEQEKELFYYLRSGNMPLAEEVLLGMFREWSHGGQMPPPSEMMEFYDELSSRIARLFMEEYAAEDNGAIAEQLRALIRRGGHRSDEYQQSIIELCRIGCEYLKRQRMADSEKQIVLALQYMKQHMDRTISLADLAQQVNLSSSYFANLFKKVTGQTVHQYMTLQKIERAKELLLQGMQVQETAKALAYEDPAYFSEVFKKNVGTTPTEFRQHFQFANTTGEEK
ncbi:response regulator [Paenibacillus glycanilyticus]|uniref:response regulator n=1 Tax=Paenibacillus glycanilyticus TaxID=126569 RepID=UPI00190FC830|nr:response regulator [Paenibacillus glycanilyticus]